MSFSWTKSIGFSLGGDRMLLQSCPSRTIYLFFLTQKKKKQYYLLMKVSLNNELHLDFKLSVSITHTACFFLFFFWSSHIHHQSCQLLCTSPTPLHRSLQKLQLLSITFHPFLVFSYIVAMIFLFVLLPKTRKSTADMYIYDNRIFFFFFFLRTMRL